MRALTYTKAYGLSLQDRERPRLNRDDEVLIAVRATGICGTDIHILGGAYHAREGLILGHESTGVVVERGSGVSRFKVGDRVILDPTYFCGTCYYCLNDRSNYCSEKASTETGVSRDGTFAEYHVARESFLHALPEELSFAEGTLSEPLACTLYALRQTRIKPESSVLVAGTGPMGLLFAVSAASMGCDVVACDIEPYRVSHASEVLAPLSLSEGSAVEPPNVTVASLQYRTLAELRPKARAGFDLIVDTTGSLMDQLLPLVDRGGDLLLVGLNYKYQVPVQPSYLTDRGIRLIGSIDTNRTFAPAIEMLRRRPAFRRIITHTLPLVEYHAAFALLGVQVECTQTHSRGAIQGGKVVISPTKHAA